MALFFFVASSSCCCCCCCLLLFVVCCCLLFVVRSSLFVVRSSLFVLRCSLFVLRCSFFVVRCCYCWDGDYQICWFLLQNFEVGLPQESPPGLLHVYNFLVGDLYKPSLATLTLQETNVSHLGKKKFIFKGAFVNGYGFVPWRVLGRGMSLQWDDGNKGFVDPMTFFVPADAKNSGFFKNKRIQCVN